MKQRIPSTRRGRRLARAVLPVALLAAFLGCRIPDAFAADASPALAQATNLDRGDAVTGALPLIQPIHIEVALKMRDREGLDAFIADNARLQASRIVPQVMTSEEFLARHAPTPVQAQAVADYLTSMGYTHVTIAPNRLLVSADGTAAMARNAFMTSFVQVHTHDGRIAYANIDDARIPAALADKVLAVVGLQSVHQAHTFIQRYVPSGVHVEAAGGHNPLEFSSIYGAFGIARPLNVTVGIVTSGDLSQVYSDVLNYEEENGLGGTDFQTTNTNGTSKDTSGTIEWDLDSQSILGAAGGQLGKIVYYNIPDLLDSSLTADFNTIVVANKAKIINVSLGLCETVAKKDGSAAAQDAILAQAVAQGQTFAVATGDKGSDECGDGSNAPSWPASSRYVTAVSGTDLGAANNTWNWESTWVGSGGSPSLFEPMPSWQQGIVPSGSKRATADIAFDGQPATGAIIIAYLSHQQFGGTSLSAPIFSGLWARMIAVKGINVGFASPLIYGALVASDFHDIVKNGNGGELAGVGYDYPSGRGSMMLDKAVQDVPPIIRNKPVARFGYIVNGLAVDFTDNSTYDPRGSIVSVKWSFGSGTGTGSAASFTYKNAGAHTVKETVTDSFGAVSSSTQVITLSSAPVTQAIQNAGFEGGTAPWFMSNVYRSGLPANAHSGNAFVEIGGSSAGKHSDHVWQTVTVPVGKTSAKLGFYLASFTQDPSTQANDLLHVQVYDTTTGLQSDLATYSNLDASPQSGRWEAHSLDMTRFMGKKVSLRFMGSNSDKNMTWWDLDDVSLNVQ
ncbi:MAG TPA: protease pro-enzyme activation domain-containing protein [Xanthomonadaceae bacterium]|jgi:subtilase family serine protease